MILDAVAINNGGHYSPNTGRFTAPHAGLYFFNADVESDTKGTTVYGSIVSDNDRHCAVSGGYGGGSGCVMVPLSAGQRMWVRADSPVDQYSRYGNQFTGILVLPFP